MRHLPLGSIRYLEQMTHLIQLMYGQRSPEESALACCALQSVTQHHSDALSPDNTRGCVLLQPPSVIKAAGMSVALLHEPWDYIHTRTHRMRHRHVINMHIHHPQCHGQWLKYVTIRTAENEGLKKTLMRILSRINVDTNPYLDPNVAFTQRGAAHSSLQPQVRNIWTHFHSTNRAT